MDPRTEAQEFNENAFEDQLYDVLSVFDRRLVLELLTSGPTPIPVERLATELAAVKRSIPAETVTADQRNEAITSLVHVHLPKLQDVGLVTWDTEERTVDRSMLVRQLSASGPLSRGLIDASSRNTASRGQPRA